MPNKPGKPKSKRTPVRLRHKIEKASAAKQRKQKKHEKNNPQWRSRLKKDPGIPNLFPYKDKLLHEIEEKKRLREEELVRKREELKASRQAPVEEEDEPETNDDEDGEGEISDLVDEDMEVDQPGHDSNPMSALLASARARAAEYDNEPDEEEDDDDDDAMDEEAPHLSIPLHPSGPKTLETSRRAYDKIFKTVLSTADILLYVLDARDPNGTRSREIERQVVAASGGSKRLLLILNKVDLVPPHVLAPWLAHLRRHFPTLPLLASTPAPNARTYTHKGLTLKSTSTALLRALKSYAASQNLSHTLTAGILGYPNVGKSSVINALTARLSRSGTACPVGAEAGVTHSLREVKIDNRLKILDSPGIVFPSSPTTTTTITTTTPPPSSSTPLPKIPHLTPPQLTLAHLTLLSALAPSLITDPLPAISLLLHRLQHNPQLTLQPLMEQYAIDPTTLIPDRETGDLTSDFLVQVARKRGRLGKGGVPNLHSAAMGVLMDWRDGRIRGWVEAPKAEDGKGEGVEVVGGWGREFQIEGLWGGGGGGAGGEMKE